jgi:hypothetical protein
VTTKVKVDTEALIATLGSELKPLRPLRPPLWRALQWLLVISVPAAIAIWRYADMAGFAARTAESRVMLECVGALLTGLVAVLAAFNLSLPDRSDRWRYAPLPPLLLWLAASGLGCLHNGLGLGPAGDRLGESSGCFKFIVMVSVPLTLLLFVALRRARPLAPLPVALCGALGVAALAAFVLQFFHPFDITVIDLVMHALAVVLVIGAAALFRRGALASR